MLAIKGTYDKGKIILQEKIAASKPVPVIVTFLEDVKGEHVTRFDANKFSFGKAKKILKDYRGSLSDAVIEERRNAL